MTDTESEQQKQPTPKIEPPQSQPQQQPTRPKVKSYLHKFYDPSSSVKDPAVYEPGPGEEDELRRLLTSGRHAKPRGCNLRPVVWKAMLWVGVNCLIFGALGLAVAFFLPHEQELVEVPGAQGFVRNQANADWNRNAGVLKYVALGIFGLGALVTAAGLVLPSLVWRLFDDEDEYSAAAAGTGSGQQTESCCCSTSTSAGRRRRQKPPLVGMQAVAAATATATTGEAPALSSLVEERPVQPARGSEEGRVCFGQLVK